MNGFDIRFARLLSEKLNDAAEDRAKTIALGMPQDWAVYREQVGYLRALQDISEHMKEIEKKLNEA